MRIVIDDKIPYIREAIASLTADAVYLDGASIGPEHVKDADALITRTRTICDERLLSGSRVSFVATATIGFDHLDTSYLRRAGIEWMSCPGCNASSVAQYVRSVLILLRRRRGTTLRGATIGVVGLGNVGSLVAAAAREEGMRVLACDPPRTAAGHYDSTATLADIEREADIVTFHVPLTTNGPHPTFHMANASFLERLARRPVIINTSRGGVVDNDALVSAIERDRVAEVVIDTWEGEPRVNRRLLELAWIATPHVAGYSADGKANATNMVIDGLCRHFNLPRPPRVEPPALPPTTILPTGEDDLRLALYNPLDDSLRLKSAPDDFERLRGEYPLRREKTS